MSIAFTQKVYTYDNYVAQAQGGPSSRSFNFMFIPEDAEAFAYRKILAEQRLSGVEISAYLVTDTKTGGRGILIQPWNANTYDSSDPYIGFDKINRVIRDYNGNVYKPLLLIHTHPDNYFHSSRADRGIAGDIGMPSIILTDKFYSIVNPYGSNRIDGYTSDIYNGASLFKYVK
jgi:hypothetical protein